VTSFVRNLIDVARLTKVNTLYISVRFAKGVCEPGSIDYMWLHVTCSIHLRSYMFTEDSVRDVAMEKRPLVKKSLS
jgi:hypothetical protein